MKLPTPHGPLGERLHLLLAADPGPVHDGVPDALLLDLARQATGAEATPDAALSLWVLHELHYRGFDDVDERWEWDPRPLAVRRLLEDGLEQRLRERFDKAVVELWPDGLPGAAVVPQVLLDLADDHDGPSLARHVERDADRDQVDDLLRQRTVYHLKEADPTSWVVPRLEAPAKAALMQVQYDEYGAGRGERLHHALFAAGLTDSGLDATYGAHVGEALTAVLEHANAVSMFGLQRRLRGAALGHLAAFEATSSLPSRRMAAGLRRLGYAESMAAYYDEHVEADAVHEQLAARDVCGALVAAEPDQVEPVLLGAWSCLDLEARSASAILARWGVAA